jgi:hypothetical protein
MSNEKVKLPEPVEKAIDLLIYAAWYSGEQDGSEGVSWTDVGDSYNQALRSEIAKKRQVLVDAIAASAGVIKAAEAVIEADRGQVLTDEYINALENAISIQRGQIKIPGAQ